MTEASIVLDERRKVFSYALVERVLSSGRPLRCEADGCQINNRDLLEVHHIVPVRIRRWHHADNLVLLCRHHHALVERFYWQALSRRAPETARELRRLARMFKKRAIKRRDLDAAREQTSWLWGHLNRLTDDPSWWRETYQKAVTWAASNRSIRNVTAANAIVEILPWWAPKSAG